MNAAVRISWSRGLGCALAVAALVLSPAPGRACDACLEDKIAATYDWEVVSAAARRGHTVVFAALRGPVRHDDPARARSVAARVAACPGVDVGTVRVSLAPPAVSFACDPRRDPPARLVAAMNRALASSHLELATVRIGAPGTKEPPRTNRPR